LPATAVLLLTACAAPPTRTVWSERGAHRGPGGTECFSMRREPIRRQLALCQDPPTRVKTCWLEYPTRSGGWVKLDLASRLCREAVAARARSRWYAGLTRSQATEAARSEVILKDYRRDAGRFNRNLNGLDLLKTRDRPGHRAWLVRFYDGQAMRWHCAYVWKSRDGNAAAQSVPCGRTRSRSD